MTFESGEPERGARAGRTVPACLVASGLLIAFLWTAHVTGVFGLSPTPSIALLLGTSLLVGLRAVGVGKFLTLDTIVGTHLVVQFALTTVLVAFSGGVASPFVPLFALPVFAGALFRDTRGGTVFASAAILVLAILGIRLGSGILLALAGHAGAFFAVAALAGHLGRETRRVDERALETSEEMARVSAATDRVLESVPVGIVIAAPDGRIRRLNRAAASTLSMGDPWEFEGVDLRELLGAIAPTLVDAFESAAVTGKWAVREEVMLGKGPDARPVGVAITPLPGEVGIAEGVVVAFTDLRELRVMERAMRRSEQLATLGELAAGVAHEIRNPLASISGAAQVLRQETKEDGDEAQLMDLIVKESERLNRIIDGFLDYTRDHSPSKALHDLALTAHEVARLLQHDRTVSIGKTILVEFPRDQDFRAMVEEEGIRQVFFNLARNALEAMQVGGILRITGESPGDGRIHVVFRDTGVGIAPHELESVFKPFQTSKSGGTGLGLSIASRIVEGHGGAIRIKSTPGVGTAVTLELPSADEPPSSFVDLVPKREEESSLQATHDAWPPSYPS